ncbi:hypothetical protein RhiirC2_784830 [Rhizophagus irregularis]|uniref:Uncharacterized protein n=1 Tax=Rhizophagus irregularis TaxID=588596 RepID=A0A2N1MXV6_9GLOM|nr:hypothetical protein RhiirC2_784830 [Rhizophagus irregularis]
MEWEKINIEAIHELRKELNIEGMEKFNQWIQKENNYLLLGKKIISLAEQNEILLEYTTLNNDFTKRLKDENRYQDNKEKGSGKFTFSTPLTENEEEDEEDEDGKEEEVNRPIEKETESPNSSKQGKKKNKRKKKNKHK